MSARVPHTPARTPDTRRSNSLQASPFSDYFTDDERSREHGRANYPSPNSDIRQVIARMQKLEAQLTREDKSGNILNVVWKKVSEIEDEVQTLQSRSDGSPDMRDSALFMQEDDAPLRPLKDDASMVHDEEQLDDTVEQSATSQEPDPNAQPVEDKEDGGKSKRTLVEQQAEHDFAILEAQRIFANVSKVQEQIRQRYAEFREMQYSSNVEIEDKEQELEGLRAENERLRSDIGFDHSELLFLKLQFKALEVEVADLEGSKRISEMKRSRIMREMKSWRTDWRAVEHKFKRRLSRYGVLSRGDNDQDLRSDSPVQHLAAYDNDDDDDWHLESVRKDVQGGKVQSITIRRLPAPVDQLDESIYLTNPPSVDKAPTPSSKRTPPPSPPHVPRLQTREQSTQTLHLAPPASSKQQQQQQQIEPPKHSLNPSSSNHQTRSPWQDLWTGLSNLAGFVEDDDDDEEADKGP
nr:hypothetical protein CFP56_60195 [Quercus suber]